MGTQAGDTTGHFARLYGKGIFMGEGRGDNHVKKKGVQRQRGVHSPAE